MEEIKLSTATNNICIGHGAGLHLTNESNQLCVKCEELDIDIIEVLSEREYELILKVLTVLEYYRNKSEVPLDLDKFVNKWHRRSAEVYREGKYKELCHINAALWFEESKTIDKMLADFALIRGNR